MTSQVWRTWLVLGFVMISLANSRADNSYCSDEAKDGDEEEIPLLDYSYSTEISVRHIRSKTLEYIHEYFDKQENKLAYTSVFYRGRGLSEIFDLNKDITTFIVGNTCNVYNTPNTTARMKNEGLKALDILLNLGKVWKYKGTQVIRGVTVKQWRACSTWNGYANFTSDYYFTMDNVPFRIDLIGLYNNGKQGSNKMRHIYDYILFRRMSPPPEVFFPPPGISCGNATMVKTPSIAQSAHFYMQKIDPITKRAKNVQVYFDRTKNFTWETDANETRVYDYKRGIQFTINKKTDKCTRNALNRFADRGQIVNNDGIIHMASLKHFLYDDGVFTYNGKRKVRGISCEVFTKRSQAAEQLGASVIEMFIAEKSIKLSDKELSFRQPVRIVMKGGKYNGPLAVKRQYEIYDFFSSGRGNYFTDVLKSCYSDDKVIRFQINFKGQAGTSWKWKYNFPTQVVNAITDALMVSPLRVDVHIPRPRGDSIQISGALYDNELIYSMYQIVPNMKWNTTYKVKSKAYKDTKNTPTICSEYCAKTEGRPFDLNSYCRGFQFNRGTKECTFYSDSVYNSYNKNENLMRSSSIDFYRWSRGTYRYEVDLSYGWSQLQRMVGKGLINVTDDIGRVLQATSITKQQQDFDIRKILGKNSPIQNFINITFEIDANPVETIDKIVLSACARHCLNNLKYVCQSFKFDIVKRKCSFYDSSKMRKRYSNQSVNQKQLTFLRLYFSYFDPFPGRSVLSPSTDEVYTGVMDGNACAQLCLKEDKFYCQSFEMCGMTCLLGRKHIYHTPSTKVKQDYTCVHYSRAYVQDYAKIKNKKALRDSNVVKIANIGVKQCATLCSTSHDYDCDVFEFCDSDSLCRLTTKSVKDSNELDYQDTGDCDLYSRRKDRQRSISSGFKSSSSSSSDSGNHSAGSMGGVAVGMILLGIVVIVVGLLVFFRLKSRAGGSDGMGVGFQKNRIEDD